MNTRIFEFDEFLLDLDEKRLLRNGQTVSLQPKVFDMLAAFVERHGELISRDELMKTVWADTFVEESNLRFCLHGLRKALGKNAKGVEYVETIPKRGYRFTAEIREKSYEVVPDKIAETESFEVTLPPEIVEQPLSGKRNWLIGIFAFSLISLSILALAWQQRRVESPKNVFGINTLAVLPFVSVGESAEEDTAFQTGLTDAMITNLSKIKELKVLPLASIRQFTEQKFDALTVGRKLETDAVLEGSHRLDGENVRVTANLLRVSDGATLWTETFTAKKPSKLELESFISLRTARLLSLKISLTEDEKSLSGTNLNSEAVQNYLAGRKIWQTRELNRHQEMVRYFKKAIELEPNWSLAYSGLAEALINDDSYLTDWESIEEITRKALQLDEANAQGHTAQAQIYHRKYWDWENAEKSFRKACSINPNYAHAHHEYGIFLGIQRRFVEAKTELQTAIELEQFSPFYYASLCELNFFDNRLDEALTQCRYAQNLETDFWRTRKQLFWIYVRKQMYAEMREMVLSKLSIEEKNKNPLFKGWQENNLRLFWQSLIDERLKSKGDASKSVAVASFYLQLGEREMALNALEQALTLREYYLPTINADPVFDPIRNEKRFVEIMRKIGLQK